MSTTVTELPVLDRQIFDMAPIGMAISTLDGKIVVANASFVKTIGYTEKELLGMTYLQITHPDDIEENLKRNQLLIEGQLEAHQMEKRFIDRDGNILHVILRVSTLSDTLGKPQFLIAQILDISDKVKLITSIESSERKFREIFENAATPMAQASTDGVIFNVNKAFEELFEYDKDELINMNISEISHPDDMIENLSQSAHLVKESGANYSMEKRYYTKSGNTVYAILKVSYIKGTSPDPPHLLGQLVDITSIKASEALLEKNNNELLKVNTELDSFIYRASHDLRGPLATMKGLVNIIDLDYGKDNQVIAGMEQSISRLENTIRKLVAFSSNAQKVVDRKEIDLERVIRESLDLYQYHPNFDKADIQIDIEPDIYFTSDLTRIKPIFNNLINNSLTYLDVDKKESTILIRCSSCESTLDIDVIDNGEGMTEETATRAFEMFYRGSEKSTGSGLGLYLVQEIIQKLNGRIIIESSFGKGTRMRVILPN